jgi:hypothetical protein
VEALPSVRVQKKDPTYPSKKRVRVDDFQGWDVRRATGESARKSRRIDKDAGTYSEHVEDREGNVIHHSEEPLAKHRGHGSAKFKKPSAGKGDWPFVITSNTGRLGIRRF